MKLFWKLNVMSMLFALLFFIPIAGMLNFYRINRIMGEKAESIIDLIILFLCLLGVVVIFLLLIKWLGYHHINYLLCITWFPYFHFYLFLSGILFPITNRGEMPNAAAGLILLLGSLIYPLCIFIIILQSHLFSEEKLRND